MRHLESCVRNAVSTRLEREAFDEEFPMHCEVCEGWGGSVSIADPYMTLQSDFGSDSVEVDNCPNCIGQNRCPRCSSEYVSDTESDDFMSHCAFCGFELGVTTGKPYQHICICSQLNN